ncbi:MAG: exo-alpha-sialidase [Hydrogenophilaceae bacterium]|nr:exo-alpha-sialidase [Hydrogenophilaceae bacterium]
MRVWLSLLLLGLAGLAGAQAEPVPKHDMAAKWLTRQAVARPLAVAASFDAKGRLWAAWVESGQLRVAQSDDGRHFTWPVLVNPVPETIAAEGESRPQIALGDDGTLHVVWSIALAKPYTGHIRYSRSTDGGRSFSPPITLNDDQAEISHRFPALLVDGKHVFIAWLDARDRQAAQVAGEKFAGASLYFAESKDGGASFGANRRFAQHSCECCRLALAWHQARPLAFWRHVFDGNVRDFALAQLTEPTAIQRASDDAWRIEGCPHHGGSLAADKWGGLHMVWFTQGQTRQGLFYRAYDGKRFSAPIKFGNDAAQAGHPVVLATGDRITVAWLEFDGKANRVWLMQSKDRGRRWSKPRMVASSEGAADYPILLDRKGKPRLVWHTEHEGLTVQDLAK